MNPFHIPHNRHQPVNDAGYSADECRVGDLLRRGLDVPASNGRVGTSWSFALQVFGLVVRRHRSSCSNKHHRGHFTVPTARTYPAIETFIAAGLKAAA